MGLRDRFFTPTTAKAILSWRILVGVGVGAAIAVAGAPIAAAVAVGAGVYGAMIGVAMPRGVTRPSIDAFTLSEPWRQLVERSRRSGRKLHETVATTADGPLKQRLDTIAQQLDKGLVEAWEIAKRGDQIDDAVRRLDPTALRSRLASLRQRSETSPSADIEIAIASVEQQLESADRLKARSEETATTLRVTQVRLDELVARAAEVQVGVQDTDTYAREVDDLVVQLEALHQAVEETRPS